MKVTIEYFGQLRQAAIAASEVMNVPDGATAQDAVRMAGSKYGGAFEQIVMGDRGEIRPSLMVVVNDQPITKARPYPLKDGDRIALIAAIAGG